MALKVILLDLRGATDEAERMRRCQEYEDQQADFEAFTKDRGWACASHLVAVGDCLVSITQMLHNQSLTVSQENFRREWFSWNAAKKLREDARRVVDEKKG